MVTSEEIKRRLEAKRKGVKSPSQERKGHPKSETSNEEIKRRLESRRRGGVEPPSGGKESSLEGETCPHCETMNPPEAKFCVGCGETLKEEKPANMPSETVERESLKTSTTANEGSLSYQQDEYKICPSCKQKNKLEAKFCVICGNKLMEEKRSGELLKTPSQPTNENIIEDSSPKAQHGDTLGGASSTPITEAQRSSEREEADTKKNEVTSPKSGMSNEKAEKVFPSDPTGKSETSSSLTENFDPVEKIRKAKELLDIGAISQEEFDQIKNKYLEQI